MNIPGFRAEASLYGESGHYRMAGAHTQANGTIQPAAIRGNYWADRCYRECGRSILQLQILTLRCHCICYLVGHLAAFPCSAAGCSH